MNRGRATTGGYSSPRGRPSRSAGPPSHLNRHVTAADGSFSDGSFSSRGGMSHGRRGNAGRVSPGSFPWYSNHRPTHSEYRVRKTLEDESFHTEGMQQNRNASNSSDSESKQSECFVASDPPHGGDSAISSTLSSSQGTQLDSAKANTDQNLLKGVIDGRSLHLDFKGKGNIVPLQNESQPSLQFGAKRWPPQEQHAKSAGSTEDPGHSNNFTVIEPFDICHSRTGTPLLKPSLLSINRQKRNEIKRSLEGQGQVLEPGMTLLKGYLSTDDQVKIVKLCQGLGLGPGGFYQPGYRDGAKLHVKMMCLGRNWDPNTSQYGEHRSIDGAKPPDIPHEFHCLVERAMKDSHALLKRNCQGSTVEDILPWMSPDICIVNFYSASGRLGLHQDKDESERSLKKGIPVVSFSIGDAGEFLYGDNRNEKDAKNILLESGDVLIFGGKSRHIFHGVRSVHTDTAPKSLLQEANLRPGRLNLTFREY